MLPYKAGNQVLNEDDRQRLELFYQRFCEGANGEQYGLDHLLFACHAAFPLILSPELTNLIWLNFSNYTTQSGPRKMDRIVCSDLLLSPVVRSVANRQFEIFPGIRTYLLNLLNDGQWFQLMGIGTFTDNRLESLAQFLRQYLAHKKKTADDLQDSFREMNEWAALAYLQPDLLAYQIANAYQKTFGAGQDSKQDVYGQLQLSLLIDRFGMQIDQNLHLEQASSPRAFLNLRQYSAANRSRLYEDNATAVSKLYSDINNDFIDSATTVRSQVRLPVPATVSQRLKRKKEGVQRVFSLLISVDNGTENQQVIERSETVPQFKNLLDEWGRQPVWDTQNTRTLAGRDATRAGILGALESITNEINEEDRVLVVFEGQVEYLQSEISIPVYDTNRSDHATYLHAADFYDLLVRKNALQTGRTQWIWVFDSYPSANVSFLPPGYLQINPRVQRVLNAEQHRDYGIPSLTDVLVETLRQAGPPITYRELFCVMRFKMKSRREVDVTGEPISFTLPAEFADYRVFTTTRKQPQIEEHLCLYDPKTDGWYIAEDDFKSLTLSATTTLTDFVTGEQVEGIAGEFFIREGRIAFGGQTEVLDKNRIYLAYPYLHPLYFTIEFSEGDFSFDKKTITDRLIAIRLDTYSNWRDLQPYESLTEQSVRHTVLEIKIYKTDVEEAYCEIASREVPDYEQKSKPPPAKGPVSKLEEMIHKFLRYRYLNQLRYADYNQSPEFKTTVNYWWTDPDGSNHQTYRDNSLVIDQHSFSIVSGSVRIHSLGMEVLSHEPEPIYFDLYLLSSNFNIVRLTNGDGNPLREGEPYTITFEQNQLFTRILEEGLEANIKVLFSRNPILVSFEQAGV